jgi:glyoxylase-like metal-dependent hydrolase (beta-lactamase superfamily II)
MAAPAFTGSQALAQTATPAPAATAQQAPGFYRFKVGDIEVTAINDGFARRPLEGLIKNASLPQVNEAMRAAFLPENTIELTFNGLVLRQGDRVTVIDTGNGDMGAPTSGNWMRNFRAAGFDPAEVDTVVLSHFHGDHINGMRLKDGTAVFPKAEVMVPAPEWAFWMDDSRMSQAPDAMKPAFQGVRRVFGPIAKDVKQFTWDKEVVPGLTAVAAPGHTPGHTAFMISSGNNKLMFLADLTNHPALFVRNPNWSAVFDMDGDLARQNRRKLLDMVSAERAQVAFYHAPFPATGFIAKDGNGFAFVPVQWTSGI